MDIRVETTKHGIVVAAYDDNRKVASGTAATPRTAALYLVRRLRRIVDTAEDLLLSLGLVTEADLESMEDDSTLGGEMKELKKP